MTYTAVDDALRVPEEVVALAPPEAPPGAEIGTPAF